MLNYSYQRGFFAMLQLFEFLSGYFLPSLVGYFVGLCVINSDLRLVRLGHWGTENRSLLGGPTKPVLRSDT